MGNKKPSCLEPVAQLEPNFDGIVIGWSSSKIVSGSHTLSPRWPPQCSCVVIEISFDPGEQLQAPGSQEPLVYKIIKMADWNRKMTKLRERKLFYVICALTNKLMMNITIWMFNILVKGTKNLSSLLVIYIHSIVKFLELMSYKQKPVLENSILS